MCFFPGFSKKKFVGNPIFAPKFLEGILKLLFLSSGIEETRTYTEAFNVFEVAREWLQRQFRQSCSVSAFIETKEYNCRKKFPPGSRRPSRIYFTHKYFCFVFSNMFCMVYAYTCNKFYMCFCA